MQNRLQRILTYSLISSICSILIGVAFYQEQVFTRYHYAFQFITIGIFGSVFYSTLRFASLRDALASLFALFIIQILITQPSGIAIFLRDFAFASAVGTSIYLFFEMSFKKGKASELVTPVIIGALLGACNLIATFILILVGGHSFLDNVPTMMVNVILGILIGFGIGAGILISDKIVGLNRA